MKEWANDIELISIHALREEGDHSFQILTYARIDFNPRPPRGGRPRASSSRGVLSVFQSTPSARRATEEAQDLLGLYLFQSTPSARRATWIWESAFLISRFQSTPSARRATHQ